MTTLNTGLTCRFCGAAPAIEATVRGHQGFLIAMRFLKQSGPYCRTCGIATVRDMSAKSLWQGWLTLVSVVVNPLTLLWNLSVWVRLRRLPEPQPESAPHLDPGRPLYQRLAMLGLLIPVAAAGALAYFGQRDVAGAVVGDCVTMSGTGRNAESDKVDCSDGSARYRIVGKLSGTEDDAGCAEYPSATMSYTMKRKTGSVVVCLEPLTPA
ncbi:LppU/SCO3897 family protein [Tsukamurella paurometabola]|uniref:Uncharacterized protein n=1 Tax=Tsukamurella paurometabola TaxID=2061 RepID=A0ABS5NEC2_TSUPA|nr:hypothetical protein [Tsukamurella paurometabola]MBS4102619.1 hypothetical protein [Tsukamurella paurometabola]